MTSIAAAPSFKISDLPAHPAVAGGGDTFAPVLAALLTPAPGGATAAPDAAAASPTGTPLPPTGSVLPPGADRAPSAPGPAAPVPTGLFPADQASDKAFRGSGDVPASRPRDGANRDPRSPPGPDALTGEAIVPPTPPADESATPTRALPPSPPRATATLLPTTASPGPPPGPDDVGSTTPAPAPAGPTPSPADPHLAATVTDRAVTAPEPSVGRRGARADVAARPARFERVVVSSPAGPILGPDNADDRLGTAATTDGAAAQLQPPALLSATTQPDPSPPPSAFQPATVVTDQRPADDPSAPRIDAARARPAMRRSLAIAPATDAPTAMTPAATAPRADPIASTEPTASIPSATTPTPRQRPAAAPVDGDVAAPSRLTPTPPPAESAPPPLPALAASFRQIDAGQTVDAKRAMPAPANPPRDRTTQADPAPLPAPASSIASTPSATAPLAPAVEMPITIATPVSAPLAETPAPSIRAATAVAPAPPRPDDVAPTPAAILPALQAFGAALHRAVVAERRPIRASDAQQVAALATATPLAPLDAAPVDTARPDWPETMVARIEAIRDTQDAADTRIRLHPDALGAVEVTLRQDGAGTHVQLRAAEAATRALLADAQPRLQELAETRGLRLAGAEVAGSGSQNGQGWTDGNRRQPAPAPTQTPIRRPAPDPVAADGATDTRLA